MTVAEMWESYRQTCAALEEDKSIFYAGAEAVCAKLAQDAFDPATRRRFDPRRAAISLDAIHTECVVERRDRESVIELTGRMPS